MTYSEQRAIGASPRCTREYENFPLLVHAHWRRHISGAAKEEEDESRPGEAQPRGGARQGGQRGQRPVCQSAAVRTRIGVSIFVLFWVCEW